VDDDYVKIFQKFHKGSHIRKMHLFRLLDGIVYKKPFTLKEAETEIYSAVYKGVKMSFQEYAGAK